MVAVGVQHVYYRKFLSVSCHVYKTYKQEFYLFVILFTFYTIYVSKYLSWFVNLYRF